MNISISLNIVEKLNARLRARKAKIKALQELVSVQEERIEGLNHLADKQAAEISRLEADPLKVLDGATSVVSAKLIDLAAISSALDVEYDKASLEIRGLIEPQRIPAAARLLQIKQQINTSLVDSLSSALDARVGVRQVPPSTFDLYLDALRHITDPDPSFSKPAARGRSK